MKLIQLEDDEFQLIYRLLDINMDDKNREFVEGIMSKMEAELD